MPSEPIDPAPTESVPPDLPSTLASLVAAIREGAAAPRHVVVTGLMGSGKTTLGRQLAAVLGWPFRDSDADLATRSGRTARDLAATDGIDALHVLELEHLVGCLAAAEPSVIAAAASVIDEPVGRDALTDPTIHVIWLRLEPAEASRRARSGSHRPQPESIADQARRRDPWFAAVADTMVDTTGQRTPADDEPLG